MTQILKLKRGSLERLSTITGSLQKGEIIFASASSEISSSNGSSILFVTTESGSIQAANRIMRTTGSTAPQLTSSVYNGIIDGVPFYASGSQTLFLLGNSSNEAIDLTGNIGKFSASVASGFSASNASIASVTGDFSSSVATSFSASAAALTQFSASLDSTFATDIALSAVSQSISASEAYLSASVSSSLASNFSSLSSSVATSFSASAFTLSQLSSSVSGTLTELSASLDSRLDSLESFSSSLDDTFATDLAVTVISQSISASQSYISASIATSLSSLSQSSGFINYVTNSVQNLTGIEVADFDSNTAVTFTNGVLKFIFGTPTAPTSVAASLSGFATDRFNNVTDVYSVNGSWNNQGYTIISASLYEGTTLLTQVGSGTSLTYSTTTSGSHTYQLQYTASSPLDNSIYTTSTTTTGTLSKSNPASPTLSATPSVQLGYSSNQIEQGATGSITFTSSSANPSNSWNLTSVTTNTTTPYYVTGSATGSTSISIIATANYASTAGDNSPDLTTTSTATTTYTKIRSLRYGASTATSFTATELENIGAWDTTLGGTIGTIAKGTTTASGQSVTISWTGDKYHYIVFNSSLSNLTNITTGGFGVFGSFAVTTVGQYKVYKSTTLKAGGAGSSITYVLT